MIAALLISQDQYVDVEGIMQDVIAMSVKTLHVQVNIQKLPQSQNSIIGFFETIKKICDFAGMVKLSEVRMCTILLSEVTVLSNYNTCI